MKALVTGAAGFVGSALARRLLDDGWSVTGVDSLTDYYDIALKRANLDRLVGDGFSFIEADLNSADLDGLLAGVEYVFHLAGQPGVRKSWGDHFSHYVEANVSATQALLEAVRRAPNVRKVVYASSSSIYGNAPRFPVVEEDLPRPVSPYGVTKLAGEHLCSLYAANFGLPVVSLRYFTVYGPGQRPDMAFTRFVRAAVRDEEIVIYGDGEQVRDFTYVDDIVAANVLAAVSPTAPGAVFNVAGTTSISVNGSLDLLSELAGVRLRISRKDVALGDVGRTGGSTALIERAIGWAPKVDLREGLANHLEWGRAAFGTS